MNVFETAQWLLLKAAASVGDRERAFYGRALETHLAAYPEAETILTESL